jgi:hypothetical protein
MNATKQMFICPQVRSVKAIPALELERDIVIPWRN